MPPSLSRRIRQFRQRIESRTERKQQEDDVDEMDEATTEDTDEGGGRLSELRRRASQDVRKAKRKVSSPFVPVTAEAREVSEEARRLGRAVRSTPEAERARAAARKAQEKREELAKFNEKVSGGTDAEEIADAFEEGAARSLEEFGGVNNDLEDVGEPVEQPLTFEAIDRAAEPDGDFTDDVVDPVAEVEAGLDFDPVEDF